MVTTQTRPTSLGGVIRREADAKTPNGVLEELATTPNIVKVLTPATEAGKDYLLKRGLAMAGCPDLAHALNPEHGPARDQPHRRAGCASQPDAGRVGNRDSHLALREPRPQAVRRSGTPLLQRRVDAAADDAHGAREAIAAIVRTIFVQPDHASALAQLRKIAEGLRSRFPRAAALLEEAAEDILAYRHLPLEHQRQLHSTNPLERLNKEIKRRSNVVGIFPNPAAVIRLVGALPLEQDDEWVVAERRYFSAESMLQLTTPTLSTTAQEILAAIA